MCVSPGVFRNIDHLTFIDGIRPIPSLSGLRDELNPEAGKSRYIQLDIIRP